MRFLTFIISISTICILGCTELLRSEPSLLTLDYKRMQEIRSGIREKSPLYLAAYQRLCKEADLALNHPSYSVIQKETIPPSGDKKDYISQAPYWWPDQEKPDGLPYIRKDGIRNPEVNDDSFDRRKLGSMVDDVTTLTLAWYYTGEVVYAEKATDMINAWFLDQETGMNPNLNYGQAIPGRVEGRGIGIIDTRKMIHVIDAVKLLQESPAWSRKETRRLQEWFDAYADWLVNSEHGKDEESHPNNHGTWYDVQLAYYSLFIGNNDRARSIVEESSHKRIDRQIDSRGRQSYELERTRAFRYSVFNLEALTTLARIGDMVGVDIWMYESPDEGSIKTACDFILDYIDRMEEWPYQQITNVEWARLIPVVVDACEIYDDPDYDTNLVFLQQKINSNDRLLLTKL